MNVFSAMMTLTGIARKYRTSKGRLVKWAKALVDGQDPKQSKRWEQDAKNIHRKE